MYHSKYFFFNVEEINSRKPCENITILLDLVRNEIVQLFINDWMIDR